MNTKNQTTLFRAIEFANWAHRDQKRKTSGAPYIVHPFHVMLLLMAYGIGEDSRDHIGILVAGALHDTLEDNPEEVTAKLIKREFGADVADLVKAVTLDPKNPDKRLSREKLLRSSSRKCMVKVADILSNTIGTTEAIKKLGFKKVQKRFKLPISERIDMERQFLCRIAYGGHEPLRRIIQSGIKALDELEAVTPKK